MASPGKATEAPRFLVHLPERQQAVPLHRIPRVRFPRTDVLSPSVPPLRTVVLRNGDRFSCEQVIPGPAAFTVSFRGVRIRIPMDQIRQLRARGPYVDVPLPATATMPPEPGSAPETPRVVALPSPLAGSRIALQLEPVSQPRSAQPAGSPREHRPRAGTAGSVELVRIQFDDGQAARQPPPSPRTSLVIRAISSGTMAEGSRCQAVLLPPAGHTPTMQSSFSQPLRLPRDSFRLSILHDTRQLLVLLNAQLLAQFRPQKSASPRMRALTLCDRADNSARPAGPAAFRTTSLTVQHRIVTASNLGPAYGDRSSVLLAEGSELFGDITFPPSGRRRQSGLLLLKSAAGSTLLNWTALSGIHPAVLPTAPVTLPAVTGTVAHITLQQPVDIPGALPDQFRAAIVGLAEPVAENASPGLLLHHPLLGRFSLPLECIREIRPQFHGTLVPLASSPFHLGESVMPAFHSPRPAGTKLTGTFQLARQPAGTVILRVVQAEVEAAGAEAPPGSPFLAELKRGGLVTRVLVNGQLLGTLNSQLRFRSSTRHPAPVMFPVPADILRAGRNTWSIVQQPDSLNPASFDDCEIGPVRLEIHH